MSHATSGLSQSQPLAPTAPQAVWATSAEIERAPGAEINVATSIDASGERAGRIKNAVLIAGPTASGKSALGLAVAERIGGVVVNADSMQGYRILDVLTARPGGAEMRRVPHRLYGHVDPATAYSTGAWLRDVIGVASREERRLVFVGGTGLYFRALCEGLSEMPEIAQATRDRWRYELMEKGSAALHRILMREDPAVAIRLRPSDGQRISRALEVLESSGRSILAWQAERDLPLLDRASAAFFVIEPLREALVSRIEARFDTMLERGAMEEARALARLGLDPQLPAMKAIGVRELIAADRGENSLLEAIERAKISTRQYAKRQATWFRHQLDEKWRKLTPEGVEISLDAVAKFISE